MPRDELGNSYVVGIWAGAGTFTPRVEVMMKHWAGLHMARGHCILCPCPCTEDEGCDTIAVTWELIAKHCTRRHVASFPKGGKGQARARGIVERYLNRWYSCHGERISGSDRWKALSLSGFAMQKLINDHYRWLGPSSSDPTPAWLVQKALEVGHSNTKCSVKTLMESMSRRAQRLCT